MTLAETLLSKLADLSATDRDGSISLSTDDGWNLTPATTRIDSIAAQFTLISGRRATPTESVLTAEQARAIADRITGLGETVSFIELDTVRNEALLRSARPRILADGCREYYEIRLMGADGFSVQRRRTDSQGAHPAPRPFALTHESTARLVDELTRS